MEESQETYGFKNVWSQDGKFFYTMQIIETKLRYFMVKLYSDG